ncbi:tyrosine-type recombinase/integrase [Spongiibacter tropicus]|uniref:tyrosine-type recombinase/integrase n=1 Tax=Spongiibacter tropicus TaxID=454602 RepID=UPI002352BF3C|nr:site-specific integrase [Spongiibacter tropicus]|tara:strand:- start:18640 stop:19983 length:1344 start_codon:yes stop_codon:yes gene_type:complete
MKPKLTLEKPYNQTNLTKAVKQGIPGMVVTGPNLYFRVSQEGSAFWIYRYISPETKKRREMSLGSVKLNGSDGLTHQQAQDKLSSQRELVKSGRDPLAEKERESRGSVIGKTVDDLAESYLSWCQGRIENPQIYERLYRDEIKPVIGGDAFASIAPTDIIAVLDAVKVRRKKEVGERPATTNDCLYLLRRIFKHGIKNGWYTRQNPTDTLSVKEDAGGEESARKRFLTSEEVETVFRVFRENIDVFGWENYTACALLLCLGVRKVQLTGLPWHEVDTENWVWTIPAEPEDPGRNKSNREIAIPISPKIRHWFQCQRIISRGSDYVFPARRMSKRSKNPFMNHSTINRAIDGLFGLPNGKGRGPRENLMAKAGIKEKFTVHDLRRTFRTHLSQIGTPLHISERCLNHSIDKLVETYDQHDWLEERAEAMDKLAERFISLIGDEPKLGP